MNTLAMLFGILFFFLFAGCCYLFYHNATNAKNLETRGLVTRAEIISKFETSTTKTDRDGIERQGPTSYMVEYKYKTHDGVEYLEIENVGKNVQESINVGYSYHLTYDPLKPEISTILDNSYKSGAELLKILMIVFAILCLISFYFCLKKS